MLRKLVIAAVFLVGLGVLGNPIMANAEPYKNCTEARERGQQHSASSDTCGVHLDRDRV